MTNNWNNSSPFETEQTATIRRKSLFGSRTLKRPRKQPIVTLRLSSGQLEELYQGIYERLSYSEQQTKRKGTEALNVRENHEWIHNLNNLYDFDISSAEIIEFLAENIFLLELLREASQKISEYFGSQIHPSLQLASLSESATPDEIFVLLPTTLAPQEIGPVLDRFDEEWWYGAADRAHCKMNIALEYV